MNEKSLDLKELSTSLLKFLQKEYGLQPQVLSLGIVLARDEFNALAADHPNAVLPDLLQSSETSKDRSLQWTVQIRPETTAKDFPPEVQERLKPPPD